MENFQKYLVNYGYNIATIKQYLKSVEGFRQWSMTQDKSIEDFNYHEMVMFIDDTMRSIYYSKNLPKTINRIMISVTYYYDYLIACKKNIYNPAKNIRIKDSHRYVVHNLLSKNELTTLYESIKLKEARDVRNKVILGFLVFQAFSVGELQRLSLSDLKLRKGQY